MSADFWAGYTSGAVGILIGNPLDLIKTRLQAGNAAPHVESAGPDAGPALAADGSPRSFRQHFDRVGTLVKGERQLPIVFRIWEEALIGNAVA